MCYPHEEYHSRLWLMNGSLLRGVTFLAGMVSTFSAFSYQFKKYCATLTHSIILVVGCGIVPFFSDIRQILCVACKSMRTERMRQS
jgi:hypothetical protein